MLSPQNPFGAVRIENDTTAERSLVAVFWTLVLCHCDRYALKSRSRFDGENTRRVPVMALLHCTICHGAASFDTLKRPAFLISSEPRFSEVSAYLGRILRSLASRQSMAWSETTFFRWSCVGS